MLQKCTKEGGLCANAHWGPGQQSVVVDEFPLSPGFLSFLDASVPYFHTVDAVAGIE